MVRAVGGIVQATTQRAELVRFYREKLGLGDPDQHGGRQFFMVGDVRLGIDGGDSRLRGPVPRTGLSFVVDDLEAQVAHMKSLGVPFDLEPTQESGGARVAVCRDPDGNFVTLMSGPSRRAAPVAVRPPKRSAKKPPPKRGAKRLAKKRR
ncbi:MAG: VOC family protein [Deltaproteobacteria bacterium]